MNGTVTATDDANSFNVQVGQSFGNCPQYIQARMFVKYSQFNHQPDLSGQLVE